MTDEGFNGAGEDLVLVRCEEGVEEVRTIST